MLRWLRRRRWFFLAGGFEEEVRRTFDKVLFDHGAGAREVARYKLERRGLPMSRKWVWKAVLSRFEALRAAGQTGLADREAGRYRNLDGGELDAFIQDFGRKASGRNQAA